MVYAMSESRVGDGPPYRCANCGEVIEPAGGHDWIGPIPGPGEPQKRYHLSTEFPECRAASGACGGEQ